MEFKQLLAEYERAVKESCNKLATQANQLNVTRLRDKILNYVLELEQAR